VVPALCAFAAGGRGDRLEDCLLRLERAGGIGSCPVEKRELDQRVRLDVADRLDGVSSQSAAALRPAAVAAQMVRWARGRAGCGTTSPACSRRLIAW
jgi:hypothetical protein